LGGHGGFFAYGNCKFCLLIPGEAASKKFHSLRTGFPRHLKSLGENEPRSGAGATPEYVVDWPLFEDLLLLKDVVKLRA